MRYPEVYALKPGEKIVVPWPKNHVEGRRHPVVPIVIKLAVAGRKIAFEKFTGAGAHIVRLANDVLSEDEIKSAVLELNENTPTTTE